MGLAWLKSATRRSLMRPMPSLAPRSGRSSWMLSTLRCGPSCNARPMLTRINLPREAILLSALAQVGLSFVVRLVLLVGVFTWFQIQPPATALLFPLGIFSLILFGFLIGVLLTPIGLLYSDVQQTLPIATTFLMLLTPVLYPIPSSGVAASIAAWNPLTPLVTATRDWITIGATSHAQGLVVIVLVSSCFCCWVGSCFALQCRI